jgi:hypothetical protein
MAIFFNIMSMIGITCIYNILESIDSPFDEKGMDDVRITSDSLQFKNDINLLINYNDYLVNYDEIEKSEKDSCIIIVNKRSSC